VSEQPERSRFAYVCALTPLIFGTTYLLTTNFLPPERPMLAALMRSLPTGIVLVIGSPLPNRQWVGRFALLSVLWASAVFPLLFFAAYHLPGGVAAVINSLGPICVVVLAVPFLGTAIRARELVAGAIGVLGVALLVLRANAKLDLLGILAMVGVVVMMALGTVLVKRWGNPPGMGPIRVTGWTFLFAGITLLPFTLAFEGLPHSVTPVQVGGLIYLVLVSGIFAYALWFWGIGQLSAASVTFLGLLNPITATLLGWLVLDQRLNLLQVLGAVLVLVSVVLGQQRRRTVPTTTPEPVEAVAGS
jgi:probable blue pigment (indigoidine) exporter